MSYNPIIPQPNNLISNSQAEILTNFTVLNNVFNVDHYKFDDATNGGLDKGMHKQVTIPIVSPMDPTLSSTNTGQFYTKTVSGATQPFFAGWNGSSTTVSQLVPKSTNNSTGSITFPGGIIMAWDRVVVNNIAPNNSFTVLPMTTVYQTTFTINDSSGTPMSRCYIASIVDNVVTVRVPTGGNVTISYIAVGV